MRSTKMSFMKSIVPTFFKLSSTTGWMACVITLLLASGCGPSSTTPSTDSAQHRPNGDHWCFPAYPEEPFKVIGDHITEEGQKVGYDTIVLSADEDVAKQSNQVKDFIVKKVSAIVLSPCESKSIVPVIQEANQAGIPVITVDIPCNEPGVKILTQVATDNFGGGREAAKAMIEALGEAGGKVAVLHYKQAESCRLRVEGFRSIIDQYNLAAEGKIDIAMELESGAAKDLGYKALGTPSRRRTARYFAINDPAALGARATLEKASQADPIIIVGFDGQPEGKQAIKDGKIFADPIQFPDRMGIEVVRSIVAHSKGEEVPAEQLIPTRLYRQADAMNDPSLQASQP